MARKMQRGRGGVEYEDIRVGEGEEVATRALSAYVSCTMSLRGGDCISNVNRTWIDLRRREDNAGLRYGIEGMRCGGIRRIVIPPRLAYGDRMVIAEVRLFLLKPSTPVHPKLKLARERKAAGIQVKPPRESKRKGRAE